MVSASAPSKMRIGRLLLALGLFVGAVTPAACVVTGTPTITGQIDCFPNFDTTASTPDVRRPYKVTATDGAYVLPADLELISCDSSTAFIGHVIIDKSSTFSSFSIVQSGANLRSTKVPIDLTGLDSSLCHLVEIYVSSEFDPSVVAGTKAKTTGDLAHISWFVYLDTGDGSSHSLERCPQ